jgi:hypothetical protein
MHNTTDTRNTFQSTIREMGDLYLTLNADERTRLFGFMQAMLEDTGITLTAHNLPNEVARVERHLRTMIDHLTK